MPIKLNGATSGSIELAVPATVSGGDVTLTLPNGVGSANQFLKSGSTAGTLEFGNLNANFNEVSPVTLSGSAVSFEGLPSTTYYIQLAVENYSQNADSDAVIRVGTSSGYLSSGYRSAAAYLGVSNAGTKYQNGFGITDSGTGLQSIFHFTAEFFLVSNNQWLFKSQGAYDNNGYLIFSAGKVDAGATLDRIQLNTLTSATYDNGVAKLRYWSN